MNGLGLTQKEKLKKWRAQKEKEASASAAPKSRLFENKPVPSGKGGRPTGHSGGLAVRPGGVNFNGAKRPAGSRGKKGALKRKPFQLDTAGMREASERRVAPGTPINMLKKRLRRAEPPAAAAPAMMALNPPAQVAEVARNSTAGGAGTGVPGASSRSNLTARAQGKGKARAPSGHCDGVSRSLDEARMKHVSEYLKSQISEANMLLEVSGVDAARTLLADMLSCTGAGKGSGELALYWAARAKLEEDAGLYGAARRTLYEGQAYVSIPIQQKVMEKVLAAFEARMNDREEVQVDQLLDNSAEENLNSSINSGNSPTSSTPFRYDPNDLSLEEDSGGANVGSAIKNLNFSRIPCAEDGGNSASRDDQPSSASSDAASVAVEDTALSIGVSGGDVSVDTSSGDGLSGVVYSDDDSDLSISDIDEAVVARAKAFTAEEDARQARLLAAQAIRSPRRACADSDTSSSSDRTVGEDSSVVTSSTKEAVVGVSRVEPTERAKSPARPQKKSKAKEKGAMAAMPPPDARPARKRKGTPLPKRSTSPGDEVENDSENAPPGSFISQVESKSKDGKRTLTPVRRSRRISGSAKAPTPSPLRREMEAML